MGVALTKSGELVLHATQNKAIHKHVILIIFIMLILIDFFVKLPL